MTKTIKILSLALVAGTAAAAFVDASHASRAEETLRTALVAITPGDPTARLPDPAASSPAGSATRSPEDSDFAAALPSRFSLPAPHEPFDTTPITPVETAGAPSDMYE